MKLICININTIKLKITKQIIQKMYNRQKCHFRELSPNIHKAIDLCQTIMHARGAKNNASINNAIVFFFL